MISDPILCILISYFFLVLIYFGGGAFTNYDGNANEVQTFFDQISPFRYSAELMVDSMMTGNKDKEQIKEILGMVEGENCYPKLGVFFIFWFTVAYLCQWWRSRSF